MKTFKQFNEGLKDKMKPKSNDEILKTLEKLPDNEKIEKIIRYQLDYNLLLRNEEGICIYNGDLYFSNNQLTSLPDNLVVKGHLDCSFNKLTSLPDNLVVKGNLDCSFNNLTSLPDNLVVKGNLECSFNKLISLPDNLVVNGYLHCSNNQLNSLPDNLVVKGDLYCKNNKLPKDIKKPKGVKEELIL
jgi:hypothetical protein